MMFKYFVIWMHHNLFLAIPLCEHLSRFHIFLLLNISVDTSLHTCLVLVFVFMCFICIITPKWGKKVKWMHKVVDSTRHRNYPDHQPLVPPPCKCHVPGPWETEWGGRIPFEGGPSCLASGSRNQHSGPSLCCSQYSPASPGPCQSQSSASEPSWVGLCCVQLGWAGKPWVEHLAYHPGIHF